MNIIKKLKELLSICNHIWETKRSTRHFDVSFGEPGYYYKTTKQCQCLKCGAWKLFKLK